MSSLSPVRIFIYSAFLLTPTTMGLYLPLTFNNKITTGYIIIILGFLSLLSFKYIRYQKSHFILLLFILLNIFYYLVTLIRYQRPVFAPEIISVTLTMATSVMAMVSVYIYYKVIILRRIDLNKFMLLFSIGVLISTTMAFSMYYEVVGTGDISNIYEYRVQLYKYMGNVKYEDQFHDLPFLTKTAAGYFKIMGGTASIGPFLSFCASILFLYYLASKDKMRNIFYLIVSLAAFGASMQMASRSAIITPLLGLSLTFYILTSLNNKKIPKHYMMVCFVIIGAIAIAIMSLLVNDSLVLNNMRLEVIKEEGRLTIWISSLILSLINPLGYGYDFIRLNNELNWGLFPHSVAFRHNHAHSVYISTLLEFGLFGFGVLIYLFYSILKEAYHNICYYSQTVYNPLSVSLFGGLIVSLMQFLFATLFLKYEAIYGSTFWLIVTMILVLSYYRKRGVFNFEGRYR